MITKEQAKHLFAPIQSDLNRAILEAWRKIHKSGLNFKSRSRASLMWDEVVNSLSIVWCDSDHIIKIEEKKSQTAHFWLNNNTFFRIKKGDENGFTRNYPTQTAIQFHDPQSTIFESVDKLEVTYVLNQAETDIVDISVVFRKRKVIDFRFSILETADIKPLPTKRTTTEKIDSVAKLKSQLPNLKDQASGDE